MRRLTKEEFIKRAKEIHGDRYDYSKVDYKNSTTKVTIVCPEHGEFEQLPFAHIGKLKQGCPECAGTKKLTKEEFIKRAREIHGDKYNYSKVDYKNSTTKVTIVCPEHGEFYQKPSKHLKGQGCPICAGNVTSTTEEFIEKSKKIYGDRYDYSKVDYKNSKIKVTIVCPEHGEFEQVPSYYLLGNGCPKCSIERRSDVLRSSNEDFIKKARMVHGDRYDYSKVDYKGAYTKVTIICPEHGEFSQTPHSHLSGASGCPRCIAYKLEEDIKELLITNSILFESQKTFEWLKNKYCLYLDFYLPEYNIAIECQGRQHFQVVDYFGGEENFKIRLENDKLKLDLCTEHGIKVIYYSDLGIDYPYEVFEDLDEILKIIKNI